MGCYLEACVLTFQILGNFLTSFCYWFLAAIFFLFHVMSWFQSRKSFCISWITVQIAYGWSQVTGEIQLLSHVSKLSVKPAYLPTWTYLNKWWPPTLCRILLLKAETISPAPTQPTDDFLGWGPPQQAGARIKSYYRSLVQGFRWHNSIGNHHIYHLWRWCPQELCRHCIQPCIAALLLYHADPQPEEFIVLS